LEFKVNINDTLDKIFDVYKNDNIGGSLMNEGKVIENPKDFTFAKKFVKHA